MGPIGFWARSRLRTKIFLAFSTLVLAVLLATLGFTQFVVSRDAERTLSRELLDDRPGVRRPGCGARRAPRIELDLARERLRPETRHRHALRCGELRSGDARLGRVELPAAHRRATALDHRRDRRCCSCTRPDRSHSRQSLAAFSPLKEAIETEELRSRHRGSRRCALSARRRPGVRTGRDRLSCCSARRSTTRSLRNSRKRRASTSPSSRRNACSHRRGPLQVRERFIPAGTGARGAPRPARAARDDACSRSPARDSCRWCFRSRPACRSR